MQIQMQERYIDTADASLYVKTLGEGPPLFVLHGGPGFSHDYFLPHMETLAAKGHQLIFMDQRGGGRSIHPYREESINMETLAADIERVRTALGFPSVRLLGHSFGGILAVYYALHYPGYVDKVILCNCAPFRQNLTWQGEEIRTKRMETAAHPLAAFFHEPSMLGQLNPGPFFMQEPHYSRTSAKLGAESFGLVEALPLHELTAPTLIIHGSSDFIPLSAAEHLVRQLPDSRLLEIENTGHFAFVEQTEAVCHGCDAFLRESRGTGASTGINA